MKLLDCTLRDGGYQNLWNFNNQFVNDYIKLMNESKIDLVEFGFRFSNYDLKYGKYAFTKESLFSQFKIPLPMQTPLIPSFKRK